MNRRSFIKSIPAIAGLFVFWKISPKEEPVQDPVDRFDIAYLEKLKNDPSIRKINKMNDYVLFHPEHVKYLQEIEEGRRFLSGINWVATEYIT